MLIHTCIYIYIHLYLIYTGRRYFHQWRLKHRQHYIRRLLPLPASTAATSASAPPVAPAVEQSSVIGRTGAVAVNRKLQYGLHTSPVSVGVAVEVGRGKGPGVSGRARMVDTSVCNYSTALARRDPSRPDIATVNYIQI